MRKVLVDSDIVLDLLLEREPYFSAAVRLFTSFQDGQLEGHLSSLAFSSLFYILRKSTSAAEAIAALRKLRLLTRVVPVDERTVDLALASSFTDFEDALQHFAACSHEVDAIITRNKRDYKASRIPILTPDECLEQLRSQTN